MDLRPPPILLNQSSKHTGKPLKLYRYFYTKLQQQQKISFPILSQMYSTCREWYNSIFETTPLPPSLHVSLATPKPQSFDCLVPETQLSGFYFAISKFVDVVF